MADVVVRNGSNVGSLGDKSSRQSHRTAPKVAIFLGLVLLPSLHAADRPSDWAVPVALEGVGNLHRISPLLFRSQQPTKIGMRNLELYGIKTVINLRALHSDDAVGSGMLNKHLRIWTWKIEDRHVIEVLRMLRHTEDGPFLIHCQHGADRTGLMSAMYRIVEQGWTKEAAIKEMTEGGYGYHSVWKNIIRYIEKVDVERIRAGVDEDRRLKT